MFTIPPIITCLTAGIVRNVWDIKGVIISRKSKDNGLVYPSIYGLWLPLWYLQTIQKKVNNRASK
jgi:hypothetical protein